MLILGVQICIGRNLQEEGGWKGESSCPVGVGRAPCIHTHLPLYPGKISISSSGVQVSHECS